MPDDDLDQMDGSALRKKLEDALKANKQLSTENARFHAAEVIATKGLTLVKAEDLAGVAIDQIETKAEALHNERRDQRIDVAKDLLRLQGIAEDELDKAVEGILAGSAPTPKSETEQVLGQINAQRALGQQAGTPVGQPSPSDLHGREAMEWAFNNPKRR